MRGMNHEDTRDLTRPVVTPKNKPQRRRDAERNLWNADLRRLHADIGLGTPTMFCSSIIHTTADT